METRDGLYKIVGWKSFSHAGRTVPPAPEIVFLVDRSVDENLYAYIYKTQTGGNGRRSN